MIERIISNMEIINKPLEAMSTKAVYAVWCGLSEVATAVDARIKACRDRLLADAKAAAADEKGHHTIAIKGGGSVTAQRRVSRKLNVIKFAELLKSANITDPLGAKRETLNQEKMLAVIQDHNVPRELYVDSVFEYDEKLIKGAVKAGLDADLVAACYDITGENFALKIEVADGI
jgi:hypothetical protein